jgi:hypothetical protein
MAAIGAPLIVDRAIQIATQLAGLAVVAGTLAAVIALLYRWYTREAIPLGLALLVGLSGVAVYLNTTTALGRAIDQNIGATQSFETALFHIVAFLVASAGAMLGQRVGDHFGTEVLLDHSIDDVDDDVGRIVKTVGRVTAVQLPDNIDDVVGYDPVPEQTKETLEGKRFVFPRNVTVEQLRDRLVSRLKNDYAVGHVDLELGADGSVEHLAIGSRAAGIGPTLPPATNAVAIRADPAFAASAGDVVQVWETDPMRRVLTAELRGVADDVVTLAIDAADTPKIDPTRRYRLVTLPVDDRPEREFASLLRAADETFASMTVEAGSPLHGMPVGALDITLIAVKSESAEPIALPNADYVLAPGDMLFAIARPELLRRLETATVPLDPALVDAVGKPTSDAPGTGAVEAPQTGSDQPTASPQEAPSEPESPGPAGAQEPAGESSPGAEESETPATGEEPGEPGAEPMESTADDGEDTSEDAEIDDTAGSSFGELKEEFDAGDADWDEESAQPGDERTADEGDASADNGDDVVPLNEANIAIDDAESDKSEGGDDGDGDVVALDDADISFGDEEESAASPDAADAGEAGPPVDETEEMGDLEFDDEADDDLDELSFDDGSAKTSGESEESDDIGDLEFDDEADDDLSGLDFDEDEASGNDLDFDDDADDAGDADSDGDSNDDTEEDDDGDGGGTSFAQLKEEFESGDADWEDDVPDDPGGDMRLDE